MALLCNFMFFTELSDQCSPLPCYKEGYERCIDGQGAYTCVCKPGWKGLHCEEGGYITLPFRKGSKRESFKLTLKLTLYWLVLVFM